MPVQYVDLSEAEEAVVLGTLDPITGLARADAAALERTLDRVRTESGAVQQLLERVAEGAGVALGREGATDPDFLPTEPPPRTQVGDCWRLGDHRLRCGDCTDAAAVTTLMGSDRAALLATDPPYLVGYDGQNHPQHWTGPQAPPTLTWDQADSPEAVCDFYQAFLAVALAEAAAPDVAVYQWHADQRRACVEDAWSAVGLHRHQQLIWVKARAVLGRSHYRWQHEPALYGWRAGHPPALQPLPSASTVWTIDQRGKDVTGHPTQKPVELFARPIRSHTAPGDVVYEPFAGSGTQIIAAERLGRRCFAMERDPRSVDLALARWEAFTGRTAEVRRG